MATAAAVYLAAGAGLGELVLYADRRRPGVFGEHSVAATWAICVLLWPLAVLKAVARRA